MSKNKIPHIFVSVDQFEKVLQSQPGTNAVILEAVGYSPIRIRSTEKHGQWIKHFDDLFPDDSTQECSVCHESEYMTLCNENYCPHCGAKMDLGEG